jgi:Holliday junction resolvasome RuvABC DNA-binding subunit
MKLKRTKLSPPTSAYLEQAKEIPKKDAERLMARMRGRLTRRLEDKTFTPIEILALQLQYEDEQLKEWRKNMKKIREKANA